MKKDSDSVSSAPIAALSTAEDRRLDKLGRVRMSEEELLALSFSDLTDRLRLLADQVRGTTERIGRLEADLRRTKEEVALQRKAFDATRDLFVTRSADYAQDPRK